MGRSAAFAAVVFVVASPAAVAQNKPSAVTASGGTAEEISKCADFARVGRNKPPVHWSSWDVEGRLLESKRTTRAFFERPVEKRQPLQPSSKQELCEHAEVVGYRLSERARRANRQRNPHRTGPRTSRANPQGSYQDQQQQGPVVKRTQSV